MASDLMGFFFINYLVLDKLHFHKKIVVYTGGANPHLGQIEKKKKLERPKLKKNNKI
jgi:hypothetical protein